MKAKSSTMTSKELCAEKGKFCSLGIAVFFNSGVRYQRYRNLLRLTRIFSECTMPKTLEAVSQIALSELQNTWPFAKATVLAFALPTPVLLTLED